MEVVGYQDRSVGDGTQLWLSGRCEKAVYVLSTKDGAQIRKIPVGSEAHWLCVWPQPGRYSSGTPA